jgi:hypothetical protein
MVVTTHFLSCPTQIRPGLDVEFSYPRYMLLEPQNLSGCSIHFPTTGKISEVNTLAQLTNWGINRAAYLHSKGYQGVTEERKNNAGEESNRSASAGNGVSGHPLRSLSVPYRKACRTIAITICPQSSSSLCKVERTKPVAPNRAIFILYSSCLERQYQRANPPALSASISIRHRRLRWEK